MDYLKIGRASDLESSKDRIIYRALEMFPGLLSWGTLISLVTFSFLKPAAVAVFAIGFDIFWFFRAVYFAFHLRAGYNRMKEHQQMDWLKKLNRLQVTDDRLQAADWKDIYHLIILPNYKEPVSVLRESLQSLVECKYPKEKMIVVLGFERRAGPQRKKVAQVITQEFKDQFFKFLVTWHPGDIEGEMAGKGSNETWAGKKVKQEIIDPLGIPYQNIIVSSFDTDTQVFPQYFSCLTYHYLTCDQPTRTSFQPIPLYTNNIWEAPILSQTSAFSGTFWQIMCQERPEKLITFSSHSMSFKSVLDVGWWQTNIVSEDSRIFWQCLLRFDGDYKVQPLYYPISMDANVGDNLWQTLTNIYKQQRRWGYGMENIPFTLFGFLKNPKISLSKKLSLGLELIEGNWSWAIAPFLILFAGHLPNLLGGTQFSQTLIYFNLPRITSRILTFSMVGILASIYYGISLFPAPPKKSGSFKYLTFAIGWFLVPFTMIFLSALPALDAQTRWMLGKYMGFWVTPKLRNHKP